MKQAKQIKPKFYKGADEKVLPIFYKGSIIYIGSEPVEIDINALLYEPKCQFLEALKEKHILEIGDK